MGGTSKSEQQTTQSSQTNPWAPAQGALNGILGGINGQVSNYQPTSAETGALGQIMGNAQNQPNYGPQATQYANSLLSGGGTAANAGILNNAYQTYQNQANPIANQNNDPMQTPGMAQLLATIRGDVSNQVNGQFAGAGRDLSGLNQQSLARGISQGEAQPLLDQYNQNVAAQQGAANNLFQAGGNTASGLQNFAQQGYANQAQGLDAGINGIQTAQNAGAQGILNAQSLSRNLPLQNLGGLLGLTLPIAGLGGQSTGTSNTQGTQQMSGAQQFGLIANGIGSLMPKAPMSFSFGG